MSAESPRSGSPRAGGGLVVVAGESLIDRIVRPDGRVDEVPGGGPFNTARALARLGVRTAFLGRFSTDAHGRRLRAALEAEGVELELAATTDDPTLIAIAELDANGSATYRFVPEHSAAAGLVSDDVPVGLPDDTVTLHVGTLGLVLEPMASTIVGLVERVGPEVLVMVDPNIRPSAIRDEAAYRARLDAVFGRADVVKMSDEDSTWLDPSQTPAALAGDLVEAGARAVLVTDGPTAVMVQTFQDWGVSVVPPRAVVDTVGAGDAFNAGFLARWIAEAHPRVDLGDFRKLMPAIHDGIAVAGWTVERAGADPPHRTDLGDVF